MSGKKEARHLARRLQRAGYAVGTNGRGHFEVRDPNRREHLLYTFSATPSDRRFRVQAETDLRRLGILRPKQEEGRRMAATVEMAMNDAIDQKRLVEAQKARIATAKQLVLSVMGELNDRYGSGGQARIAEKMVELSGEGNAPESVNSAVTQLYELRENNRGSEVMLNVIENTVRWFIDHADEARTEMDARHAQIASERAEVARRSAQQMHEKVVEKTVEKVKKADEVSVTWQCREGCDKTFDTAQGRNLHENQHKQVKCEICGKKFAIGGAINAHLKWHATEDAKVAEPVREAETFQHSDTYRQLQRKLRQDLTTAIEKYGFSAIAVASVRETTAMGGRASANIASAQASLRRIMQGRTVDTWVTDQFRNGLNWLTRQEETKAAQAKNETEQLERQLEQAFPEGTPEPQPMEVMTVETATEEQKVEATKDLSIAFETMQMLVDRGVDAETTLEVGRKILGFEQQGE